MNDGLISIDEGMEDWSMLQSRNIIGSKSFEEKKTERFYRFDSDLTDEDFLTKYYEYRQDRNYFKIDFKPEDETRAGRIMEELIEEKAKKLGIDLEIAKSVVATAIVKKQNELSGKFARSIHIDQVENELFEKLGSLTLVELDSIIYNVLYGCYLSNRTKHEILFEFYELNSTTCYILSKNGLRLMNITMTCSPEPSKRSGTITCTVGPGATRELAFNPDMEDIDSKIEGFDLESIFELSENCMDLSGKQIQDIFVSHLSGVKYTCHDIFDIESFLTSEGINLDDFIVRPVSEDQTNMEQSKETLCLVAAESYIRNKWFSNKSGVGVGCDLSTCYDTGENSFNYSEWGKPDDVIRFGKAINIAPYRRKHYADLTYPDIEFNFAIVGTVFELYVSGLTMRTNPTQGLEAILKIDYDKLVDEVSDVLGKVSMDRKNLDNLFDLELSL